MAEVSAEALAAYARHEREIGLQRLRLGCWIAMALTPAGFIIDLLYLRDLYPDDFWGFFLTRVVCSLAILPILHLSYRPLGTLRFRMLGVLLAFAPAACMAWIIFHTDQASSPYYAGMNLVLLGVALVMQWTVVQSLAAVILVVTLYLGAVFPRPGSSPVSAAHIVDLPDVAKRLLQGAEAPDRPRDPFYVGLWSQQSPRTRIHLLLYQTLKERAAQTPAWQECRRLQEDVLKEALANDLRRITESPMRIRQVEDSPVQFREVTVDLAAKDPSGSKLHRLNRLLLEDSFPGMIVGSGKWQGGILANNLWFLALTAVLVLIGSHVSSRLRFSDFVARIHLDHSRRELERTNERLGETNDQLEHTNQRLRELDELKGRFFANISHELRTPLTLLLGPIESLLQHQAVTGDERLREYVGTMQDNGLRLLKLINDLLDLVRLDAGQLKLHKVRIDVGSFTGGLMNAVRRFAEDRGLRVACSTAPELRYITADPDKLEKVFLNLLFNSIKFTPAGGEVHLSGTRDGNHAVFAVRDTGVGISPANLSQLFQRFWQADSSAHRKYQGAGIGLALVKELVVAHGGEVSARSEVGQGTTMTVRIPVGSETAEAGAAEPVQAPEEGTATSAAEGRRPNGESEPGTMALDTRRHLAALYKRAELQASITPLRSSLRPWAPGPGGNRPEVLVVDDEPDMLRFLRGQLEDDYLVREAVDGDQATSMAAQYLPDAVVCDMMLPEKDGLQVCRELRANHITRGVPFLMLTARADDETKLAALSAGATDFLAKPFSTAELKVRLKNLVDAQRLQKELGRQNRKLEHTLEELRDTESQLVQAEKMASLGRLSAGIIHEINNPLNFARTGLHVLSRHGRRLPEDIRIEFEEVLRDISDGITRVSTIVGDLRQFSHPQADAVSEVDVGRAVEAALRFLAADWKDGRSEMINEVPDGFGVYANRNKLVQVLLNLCQNAFDAMRDKPPVDGAKPCVRLRAWRADGRRYVSVRDNGPGIPPNHLAHIFEPFYTTKEVGKGMGLGLSICYRIMEEVGGRIAVNTEVGKFCEFILDFPDRLEDKQPSPGEGPNVSA